MNARPTSWIPGLLATLAFVAIPALGAGCIAPAEPDDGTDPALETDAEEPTGSRDDAVTGGTVNDAVANSCATSSVKGLSLQIIEEGKCIAPEAYVEVPQLPNVSFGPNVFAYLEQPARDKLVDALNASPNTKLTVNSMLRTVAQQYLLSRWGAAGKCGIGLAAKPGNSNHETGLAMDINEYSAWRTTLENRGFRWFGTKDKVHFDYVGTGAKSFKGVDVKAFQRLWNRNNPNDQIAEDGVWGPNTEARMKRSPAQGFAVGAQCATQPPPPDPMPVQCGHALCVEGAALDSTCDACVTKVCAADSFCCTDSWDNICIGEVASICELTCGGA